MKLLQKLSITVNYVVSMQITLRGDSFETFVFKGIFSNFTWILTMVYKKEKRPKKLKETDVFKQQSLNPISHLSQTHLLTE